MDQRDVWDDLMGDAWVRNADILDAHGRPFGLAAMERLGPVDGQRVLDIGCGTGATTRELAGRGASVTGIDLSARMTDEARRRADPTAAIEHRVGSVEDLQPDEPFDALFSRFGVMFFDDSVAAFRHLRSITRPGGRIGFSAWNVVTENPWMTVPVLASIPHLGIPEMLGPDRPGPFALAPEERATEVLTAAGWKDPRVEALSIEQEHPTDTLDDAATVFLEDNPPVADGLRRHPELRDEVRATIVEGLAPYQRDGRLVLPASALIASARA